MKRIKQNHSYYTPRNHNTYHSYSFINDDIEECNRKRKKRPLKKCNTKRICRHLVSGKCEVNSKYCIFDKITRETNPSRMQKCKWYL